MSEKRAEFGWSHWRAVSCAAVLLSAGPTAAGQSGFSLGVAAGDVTDSAAIIWTRPDEAGPLRLELAGDDSFSDLLQTVSVSADPEQDLAVRVELEDLAPGTRYFYRFVAQEAAGVISPTGVFQTTPAADQASALRFVFSGDTNFRHAPYTLMSHIADEQANFFVWFGDIIYADAPAGGLGPATTLDEYRAKYRQTWADPNVREALAATPVWSGWDDHEVRNDYAGLDPLLPAEQRDAAYTAFFEYLPIRDQGVADDPFRTYRRFRFGTEVEFFLLDERQYRDVPAEVECGLNLDPLGFVLGPLTRDGACVAELSAPRTMLGAAQFDWLTAGLRDSTARVKFVVNNVPMSFVGVLPYDRWDGYDAERRALLEFIDANRIQGVILLTTDIHANAYNPDVMRFFRANRPDYRLGNGVQLPEVIVGPLGNATLRQSLLSFAGGNGEGLLGAGEQAFVDRLTCVNGFQFAETDRLSYAVIDVSPTGDVRLRYRGLRPADAADQTAVPETFFDTAVEPAPPLPCCLPILVVGAAAHCGLAGMRRERRAQRG